MDLLIILPLIIILIDNFQSSDASLTYNTGYGKTYSRHLILKAKIYEMPGRWKKPLIRIQALPKKKGNISTVALRKNQKTLTALFYTTPL